MIHRLFETESVKKLTPNRAKRAEIWRYPMKRVLNFAVWCVLASALLVKRHRDRKEKR